MKYQLKKIPFGIEVRIIFLIVVNNLWEYLETNWGFFYIANFFWSRFSGWFVSDGRRDQVVFCVGSARQTKFVRFCCVFLLLRRRRISFICTVWTKENLDARPPYFIFHLHDNQMLVIVRPGENFNCRISAFIVGVEHEVIYSPLWDICIARIWLSQERYIAITMLSILIL